MLLPHLFRGIVVALLFAWTGQNILSGHLDRISIEMSDYSEAGDPSEEQDKKEKEEEALKDIIHEMPARFSVGRAGHLLIAHDSTYWAHPFIEIFSPPPELPTA